jgi:hypothetical protein
LALLTGLLRLLLLTALLLLSLRRGLITLAGSLISLRLRGVALVRASTRGLLLRLLHRLLLINDLAARVLLCLRNCRRARRQIAGVGLRRTEHALTAEQRRIEDRRRIEVRRTAGKIRDSGGSAGGREQTSGRLRNRAALV